MSDKVQTLIFSRSLLQDALNQGYLEELDGVFKQLNEKGIKISFITQRSWVLPAGLSSLTAEIEKLSCKNRRIKGLAGAVLEKANGCIQKSVVVSTSDTDIIMAANSGIMSITAGWANNLEDKAKNNGISVKHWNGLPKVMELISGTEPWYSIWDRGDFKIYSLLNAGDYQNIEELKPLVSKMKDDLKEAPNSYWVLFKFLLASSLLKTEELRNVNYIGIYPSSSVKNFDDELIYKYYKTSKFAISNTSKIEPILIRNTNSQKRHAGGVVDRNDPNLQLNSIHVNPFYKGKLRGKSVLILDDFTTNGTSFCVANALLKKAGAEKVFCVALGKYGHRLHDYEIDLSQRDPFSPSADIVEYKYNKNDDSVRNAKALDEFLKKYEALK